MEGLTIELTDSELSKYNANKKDEKDLPKYYSLDVGGSVPISRDMEAFLILEDFKFKDTITDALKAILHNAANDDEKELFEEAWDNDLEVTRNEIADLNSKLGTTAEVRNGVRTSKFVNVSDINELLTTISSEQSALSVKQRIAQYHLTYLEQFKLKFQPGEEANQDYVKATESWLGPLTKY